MLATRAIETPLGTMNAAATERGLCALELPGERTERAMRVLAGRSESGDDCVPGPAGGTLDGAEEQLAAYFAGDRSAFDLPIELAPAGAASPVGGRGWLALRELPCGEARGFDVDDRSRRPRDRGGRDADGIRRRARSQEEVAATRGRLATITNAL